jgi:hypothetical protein
MKLDIEYNLQFTPEAEAAMPNAKGWTFDIEGDLDLQLGDLFSVEELMPHVFVVIRRHLHLVDPGLGQMSYLLDLHHP